MDTQERMKVETETVEDINEVVNEYPYNELGMRIVGDPGGGPLTVKNAKRQYALSYVLFVGLIVVVRAKFGVLLYAARGGRGISMAVLNSRVRNAVNDLDQARHMLTDNEDFIGYGSAKFLNELYGIKAQIELLVAGYKKSGAFACLTMAAEQCGVLMELPTLINQSLEHPPSKLTKKNFEVLKNFAKKYR